MKSFNIFAVESHAENNFKDTGKSIKGKPRCQEAYWYKTDTRGWRVSALVSHVSSFNKI